ncbi:hypothetical protein evm_005839 [Chilo suppressalis]|nr:hypothetical protein evm_005839 [Chilo suppressalis]
MTLVLAGVGCHHAGLLYEERFNIEQAFRNRNLPILITTTTLAMGVNLPAHLVIVKNTQQYVNGAYQEYSISTVLQMLGRAGRPQFDTDATAVIMTRQRDKLLTVRITFVLSDWYNTIQTNFGCEVSSSGGGVRNKRNLRFAGVFTIDVDNGLKDALMKIQLSR